MATTIEMSYSIKGDGIITEPSLVTNYKYRIPDALEQIESLDAVNDPLISVSYKNYYMKEFGDTTVTSSKIQQLGLNNLWTNENTCSLVQQ